MFCNIFRSRVGSIERRHVIEVCTYKWFDNAVDDLFEFVEVEEEPVCVEFRSRYHHGEMPIVVMGSFRYAFDGNSVTGCEDALNREFIHEFDDRRGVQSRKEVW